MFWRYLGKGWLNKWTNDWLRHLVGRSHLQQVCQKCWDSDNFCPGQSYSLVWAVEELASSSDTGVNSAPTGQHSPHAGRREWPGGRLIAHGYDNNGDDCDDNWDADTDLGGAPVLIVWVVFTSAAGVGTAPGEGNLLMLTQKGSWRRKKSRIQEAPILWILTFWGHFFAFFVHYLWLFCHFFATFLFKKTCVTYHESHVMCHMSHVTCHLPPVTKNHYNFWTSNAILILFFIKNPKNHTYLFYLTNPV